ncbi:hypothetical protein HNQ02_002736 [Flavobacterium sp. 7E]|uniref:hypothetical protein n=1 Tax=unclassified Flavobacterium TaxID=196869 RepID=UPI00156EA3D9|nr:MULTISPECIES: hypothetical protein [unclassified Flavobacterium]MBE0391876.1 hypothetical protein [Flavobacterium sp. PL002]NRS89802.1 hypothetical protein [Flavobacterium sp. 7E]
MEKVFKKDILNIYSKFQDNIIQQLEYHHYVLSIILIEKNLDKENQIEKYLGVQQKKNI